MHTPGPWKLIVNDMPDYDYAVVTDEPALREIALVNGCRATVDEGVANACLLASAPELLAACQSLLDDIDDESGTILQFHCSLIHDIRKAVSKARGRKVRGTQ